MEQCEGNNKKSKHDIKRVNKLRSNVSYVQQWEGNNRISKHAIKRINKLRPNVSYVEQWEGNNRKSKHAIKRVNKLRCNVSYVEQWEGNNRKSKHDIKSTMDVYTVPGGQSDGSRIYPIRAEHFKTRAMRKLVCNRRSGSEAALQLQGQIEGAFSSNSLVKTMEMTAVLQYILTELQWFGSQDYYKKSRYFGLLVYYSVKTSKHRQNGLSYVPKKILT